MSKFALELLKSYYVFQPELVNLGLISFPNNKTDVISEITQLSPRKNTTKNYTIKELIVDRSVPASKGSESAPINSTTPTKNIDNAPTNSTPTRKDTEDKPTFTLNGNEELMDTSTEI